MNKVIFWPWRVSSFHPYNHFLSWLPPFSLGHSNQIYLHLLRPSLASRTLFDSNIPSNGSLVFPFGNFGSVWLFVNGCCRVGFLAVSRILCFSSSVGELSGLHKRISKRMSYLKFCFLCCYVAGLLRCRNNTMDFVNFRALCGWLWFLLTLNSLCFRYTISYFLPRGISQRVGYLNISFQSVGLS